MPVRRRLGAGLVGFSLIVTFLALVPAPASALPSTWEVGGRVRITTTSLPDATFGQAYAFAIQAVDECPSPALHFFAPEVGGALPPGMSLAADGHLAGTPAGDGTYQLTVVAQDDACAAYHAVRFTLTVAAPAGSEGAYTFGSLPQGRTEFDYDAQLTASAPAALGPLTWQLVGGALPEGVQLANDGHIEGHLDLSSGGSYPIDVRVTDQNGLTGTHHDVLDVRQGPAARLQDPPSAVVGQAYSSQLHVIGPRDAPYAWQLQAGEGDGLPPGLAMATDGTITGTPTAPGAYHLRVMVTDASGDQGFTGDDLYLQVFDPGLVVDVQEVPGFAPGSPYHHQFVATGGVPPYTWALENSPGPGLAPLPSGLSLGADGVISGTTTEPGSEWRAWATVQDATGRSARFHWVLRAAFPKLWVSDSDHLARAVIGQPFEDGPQFDAGCGRTGISITSGPLPDGLELWPDGKIRGTPSASSAGSHTVDFALVDACGFVKQVSQQLTVGDPLPPPLTVTSSLPDLVVGQTVDFQFAATGGCPGPQSWSLSNDPLPGMTLAADGRLTGTPTTSGDYVSTVVVRDSCEGVGTETHRLTITGPMAFGPVPLPAGYAGDPYAQQLTVSGDGLVAPITFAVDTSTPLPATMQVTPGGMLVGTPGGGPESWTFDVRATDAEGRTQLHRYHWAVRGRLRLSTGTLGRGTVGRSYLAKLSAVNVEGTATWSVTDGALPAGLALGQDGRIAGTPTAGGTASFTVTVTDAGHSASREYSIQIASPLAITTASLPDGQAGVEYAQPLALGGGWPSYEWTLDGGSLPPGLVLWSYGTVRGTPTAGGTYTFTAKVTDADGNVASRALSLTTSAPTAPRTPTLSVGGAAGRLQATWSTGFDGGSPITGWTLQPYRDGVALPALTYPAATRSVDLTLADGAIELHHGYAYEVTATTTAGSTTSLRSAPIVPWDRPGAPTNVAAAAGRGRAVVTWDAPSYDGGSDVTGYRVEGASGATATIVGPAARAVTVGALEAGTVHRFRVTTITDPAESLPSPQTDPVTILPTAVPSEPAVTSAVPGDGTVKLVWSKPVDDGGLTITDYRVTPYVGGVAQPTVVVGWGATSTTITGLTNGTTYTFRVAGKNNKGVGAQSAEFGPVAAGAPGLPGFQGAQTGNGGAKVAWTAAPANGAAVTSYVVTPFLGSTALPPTTVAGTATSAQVAGLTNGETYTFAVAAVNARGTGPGAVTAPIIVGAPTTSGFVSAVPERTSARVGWSGATANGAPVTAYEITPYFGSTPLATKVVSASTYRTTITGLTTGATYTFKIFARNSFGLGPETRTSPVVIGTPEYPGFQSAAPTDGGAVVQFATPPGNASPVTSYTVWPVKNGTVMAPQVFDTPSATRLTVTGLTNGQTYSFRVAATNGLGQGPYAATNSLVVGAPGAPAFPAAAPGNGSAKVAWQASPANAAPITSYLVTPYLGATALSSRSVAAPASNLVVTGLTNGQTYSFKVQALNAFGTSIATTTSSVKVGTPTGPGFPTVTANGGGTVTIKALASTANGAPITGYVITPVVGTVAKPSKTFAGTGTTWVFTGLTPGTAYTFRIAAVNSYGPGPFATTKAVTVT